MGNSQGVEDSVGGQNMIMVAGIFRSRLLQSIEEAERLLGKPPNTPQTIVVFFHHHTTLFNNAQVNAFL